MKTLRYILGIAIVTLCSNCNMHQHNTGSEKLAELTCISVNTSNETYSLRRINSKEFKFTYYNSLNSNAPPKYIFQLRNLTKHDASLFLSKIQEIMNIADKPSLGSYIQGDYPSSNYVSLAIPSKHKSKLLGEDYFIYNGEIPALESCFQSLLGELEKLRLSPYPVKIAKLHAVRREKLAGSIVHMRDWRQLYFMDVHTLAKANVYSRYIYFSYPLNCSINNEGAYYIGSDDSELIRLIIEEWLVKYPSNEEAWNLIEFYMLYQSKKRPYFSLIYDTLEAKDLLTHPRAAIMLKYKTEMDQLAKSEKGYVNENMFNEIKARIIGQGVKHTLSEWGGDNYFQSLTTKEKDELAQLIIHSHDWDKNKNFVCENISGELILPIIKKKAPQYADLFEQISIDWDTNQSWLFEFIIREWLCKHPDDKKAWDFIEFHMPVYESETPYFTVIRHSLEECNLLNTPRAFIMSEYDFECTRYKNCDIKPFNDLYKALKNAKRSKL